MGGDGQRRPVRRADRQLAVLLRPGNSGGDHSGEDVRVEGMVWTLSFKPDKTPGRLTGHWASFGKAHNIKGATDDTLVAFEIKGSDNRILQKLDYPTDGNFDIKYSGGDITFVFDNQGIVRNSDRDVTLTGSYQPD